MNPAPQEPSPSLATRSRWFKKAATHGFRLLLILGIVSICVWSYLRSGRFSHYVSNQLKTKLLEYGLRGEVGDFTASFASNRAILHNLKIYNLKTGQIIASVKTIEASLELPDLYSLKLSREVRLKKSTLDGLELFFEFDEKGKSNFEGVHDTPAVSTSLRLDTTQFQLHLADAEIHVKDASRKLNADLFNINAEAQRADGASDLYRLIVRAAGGNVEYEGRGTKLDALDLVAKISETGAVIEKAGLKGDAGEILTKGRLQYSPAQNVDLDLEAKVKLDVVSRLLAFPNPLKGAAKTTAHLQSDGGKLKAKGELRADELVIGETRLRELLADGVEMDVDKAGARLAAARLSAGTVENEEIRFSGIAIDGLKLASQKGEVHATSPKARIASLDWPDGNATTLELENLTAEFPRAGVYKLTAQATAEKGQAGELQFSRVKSSPVFDQGGLFLHELTGETLGGRLTGDLSLPRGAGVPLHLKAVYEDVDLKMASAVLGSKDMPFASKAHGTVDVDFLGVDPRKLSGDLNVRLEQAESLAANEIPLAGELSAEIKSGVFSFSRSRLATNTSSVAIDGSMAIDGESNLGFTLESSGAEELLKIAHTFPPLQAFLTENEPKLHGELNFNGKVAGNLNWTSIDGDLDLEDLGLHDAKIGRLSGRLSLSTTDIKVQNGVITSPDGGVINFEFEAPLEPGSSDGKLEAKLDHIKLDAILAAVGAPKLNQFITGELIGEASFRGLPASPTGTAKFKLDGGTVGVQSTEAATLEFRAENKRLLLDRMEINLPQSRLLASGSMSLEDYSFAIRGKADQLRVENLAQTLGLDAFKIEGAADAEVDLQGKAIISGVKSGLDWESIRVQLTAEGKQVRLNGEDAGELRLSAVTSPGGRVDATLVTGLLSKVDEIEGMHRPETIRGSVELQKPGRPVLVESELNELNIAPLLAILAPRQATSLEGSVSGKLRIEGPSADAQGDPSFDLLRGGFTLVDSNLRSGDSPVRVEVPTKIVFEKMEIRAPETRIFGQGVDLTIGGSFGLRSNASVNASLKGVVNLDRLPSISPGFSMFGAVTIDAKAQGPLDAPILSGRMDLANFALSSTSQPIFITEGRGSLTLAGDELTLEKFTARANDGSIEASGTAKLEKLSPKEWKYQIKATNAEAALEEISGNISGALTLTGTPEGQQLSGTVSILQAEYRPKLDFDAIAAGGASSLAVGNFDATRARLKKLEIPPVSLNVRVEARDSLIIQNEQINTIGSGLLVINGRLDDPDLSGRITLDGGTLRFRGQRYEIVTGAMDLPLGSSTPLLNLVAEGSTSGYRINIGLVGPIDDLDLTLQSEPLLARPEIISLMTTGRIDAGTLNSQDPLLSGVGAAASLLSSGLISRPAEQLLGLSRFQIDPVIRPNANPAARLTVGEQLSRNFYVSYATNLATEQDQTALAEYTLSNRFSALATYTQGGSAARQGLREGVFTLELRGRQRFALGFNPDRTLSPGDPKGALNRIVRPKLPAAQVDVADIAGLKLGPKKLRELLPVMTQGFSRSLARLGERRLTEHLQEAGYFFAEVKSRCEPENCTGENLKVFYEIDPSLVYDLKEIRIEGTDLVRLVDIQRSLQSQTANRLAKTPYLKAVPIIGGYVRGLTSGDRLNNDEEFLRNYLVDRGYLNARVESRVAVKPDNQDLILIFDINAGPQYKVAETSVQGNLLLPASDLLNAISARSGEPFSPSRIRLWGQQIKQVYAQQGFLEAAVEVETQEAPGDQVKLVYKVNEGSRAVIQDVQIAGLTKTIEAGIKRFLDFKPGEILTPAKIRRTQRDLYSTNAFREVNIRAEALGGDDGSAHKVTLDLTEAKPLLFVYGLGYSSDDGARGLLELANTNLGGTLDSLSLRLRGSRRDQFSQLSFTDLRPFGLLFPTTVSVFYNRNSNLIPFVRRRIKNDQGDVTESNDGRSFGLNRFAGFIQTQRKLNDRTSLRLRYNMEHASLFDLDPNFPDTEVTRNERSIKLGMVSIGLTRDTRDSALNATRGELLSMDHSLAATMLGGNESFNKFFATYQRYKTLGTSTPVLKDSTLAFSARVGLAGVYRNADRDGNGKIDPLEMNQQLPISERFFSGGATTLRGFRFETAGPQIILEPRTAGELPTLAPVGGDALAIFNFEIRYPLTRRLRLVPFYDLGNVFSRIRDIQFGGMTNSVGVGLRINSPLGPIGVDYGFLIDPPKYATASGAALIQPRGAFHIRFGQSF